MKINKSIMLVALGLSVAGLAKADELFLTGSTAARSAVYSTMTNPGSVFISAPAFTGFGGSGSGDNYMAFAGTLVGGSGTTIINCHWSGSEGGIVDVATTGGTNETFIDNSLINLTGSSDPSGNPGTTTNHVVDLAMADNAQAYSPAGSKLPSVADEAGVGIIPFKWVRNPGFWTGTNVTDSEIRQSLSGGAKLAVFTGNAGDTNSYVYVSGRDSNSGTRVNALGDSGFGSATAVNQIILDTNGVMQAQQVISHGHTNTVYIGNFGQSSGGTLAGTLGASTTSQSDSVHSITGFSVISYLGKSDSATAIGKGATELTYDGIPYSNANIAEGNYTFWGNEYVEETANTYAGQSANIGAVFSDLTGTNGVVAQADNVTLLPFSFMHCSRVGPSTDPVHN